MIWSAILRCLTASRPICEVKQRQVWIVLGWVTTGEVQMLIIFGHLIPLIFDWQNLFRRRFSSLLPLISALIHSKQAHLHCNGNCNNFHKRTNSLKEHFIAPILEYTYHRNQFPEIYSYNDSRLEIWSRHSHIPVDIFTKLLPTKWTCVACAVNYFRITLPLRCYVKNINIMITVNFKFCRGQSRFTSRTGAADQEAKRKPQKPSEWLVLQLPQTLFAHFWSLLCPFKQKTPKHDFQWGHLWLLALFLTKLMNRLLWIVKQSNHQYYCRSYVIIYWSWMTWLNEISIWIVNCNGSWTNDWIKWIVFECLHCIEMNEWIESSIKVSCARMID